MRLLRFVNPLKSVWWAQSRCWNSRHWWHLKAKKASATDRIQAQMAFWPFGPQKGESMRWTLEVACTCTPAVAVGAFTGCAVRVLHARRSVGPISSGAFLVEK